MATRQRKRLNFPLLQDLLPEQLIIECPFHEVSNDDDWVKTQLSIVRSCECFGEWRRNALCTPRDSVHCYLCHQSLRRLVTLTPSDEKLARNRQCINTCR